MTDSDLDPVDDSGFTLVELLVAMALFSVLGGILLGIGLSTGSMASQTRQLATVGDESRLGMERMTRELRESAKIAAVSFPSAATDPTTVKLWADFNLDGCINPSAADPEELTYTWDPTTQYLSQTAVVGATPRTSRLLSTKVSAFTVTLSSSAWQYDSTPSDGKPTTWQDIDNSSIGDHSQSSFTDTELEYLDLVGLSVTTREGSHQKTYSTQVDLRNQNPDNQIGLCSP